MSPVSSMSSWPVTNMGPCGDRLKRRRLLFRWMNLKKLDEWSLISTRIVISLKGQRQIIFGTLPHHALLSVSGQVSAKFDTCSVVGLNGTLVEAKMFTFTIERMHFIFNKCPIYRPTTVKMWNLALVETNGLQTYYLFRITIFCRCTDKKLRGKFFSFTWEILMRSGSKHTSENVRKVSVRSLSVSLFIEKEPRKQLRM